MKLPRPFYRLPVRFDVERLREEVLAFPEEAWQRHPTGYAGNSAIRLISPEGEETDAVDGHMLPTAHLLGSPYIQQVLASFNVVFSRSRLMRLAGHSVVPQHSDTNYHWHNRVRIHIPIITYPEVRFYCDQESVHMGAGEAWVFDNWRQHRVENPSPHTRIHLVADTIGSSGFWDLVSRGQVQDFDTPRDSLFLPYRPEQRVELLTERVNTATVMPPAELEALCLDLLGDLAVTANHPQAEAVRQHLIRAVRALCQDWRMLWSLHGDAPSGWASYQQLLERTSAAIGSVPLPAVLRSNGVAADKVIHAKVLSVALNPTAVPYRPAARPGPRFERPVFIIAAPRSGSTLLFETLSQAAGFQTIGGESHLIFEELPELRPNAPGAEGNRLTEREATPAMAQYIRERFWSELRDRDGQPPANDTTVRMLEKTPKNALRIPFLDAVFPDALFVVLHRDPRENISSIMEAWRSGKWITYPRLRDWDGPWSLLVPPGYPALAGQALETIAATQWENTNRILLDDLEQLDPARWMALGYDELLADPQQAVARICRFADIPLDPELQDYLQRPLPQSRYTHTPPERNKWQKNAEAIERVLPLVEATAERLRGLEN